MRKYTRWGESPRVREEKGQRFGKKTDMEVATLKKKQVILELIAKVALYLLLIQKSDWKKGKSGSYRSTVGCWQSYRLTTTGGEGMNSGSKNLLCKLVTRRLKEGKQRLTRGTTVDTGAALRSLEKGILVERQMGGVKSVTINSDRREQSAREGLLVTSPTPSTPVERRIWFLLHTEPVAQRPK